MPWRPRAALIRALILSSTPPAVGGCAASRLSPPTPPAFSCAALIPEGDRKPVGPTAVQLYYRRTHQAEAWRSVAMEGFQGGYRATIPGDYTASLFPLEYYFEVSDASGRRSLYPELGANLCNQPYFVMRS